MKGKIGSHQWHQQHKIPACQSHQWWILPLSVCMYVLPLSVDRSTHRSTHTKGATCSNKIIKYCRNFCSCYCSYCSFKYNSNAPFKRLCVLIFIFSQSLVALMSFTGRNHQHTVTIGSLFTMRMTSATIQLLKMFSSDYSSICTHCLSLTFYHALTIDTFKHRITIDV